jgi:hypothetical protein
MPAFDDGFQVPRPDGPTIAFVLGIVCAGKTTFRRKHFGKEWVVVDAGELYLAANGGDWRGFAQTNAPMERVRDNCEVLVLSAGVSTALTLDRAPPDVIAAVERGRSCIPWRETIPTKAGAVVVNDSELRNCPPLRKRRNSWRRKGETERAMR